MPVFIRKVKEEFGWLGNMSPYPIVFQTQVWRTTEALFQALRFSRDPADGHGCLIYEEIREQTSPIAAKMVAKKHADSMHVEPMSDKDLKNMEFCLRLKLEQHPHLEQELLATGDEEIIEDVTSRKGGRHRFWGMALVDGNWVGENALGKLWMKLRKEKRSE